MKNTRQNKILIAAICLMVIASGTGLFVAAQTPAPMPQTQEEKFSEVIKAVEESTKLRNEGTLEVLPMVIMKLQTAKELFVQVGAKSEEAMVNFAIGRNYSDLGKNQEALNCYNQALTIQRAIGSKESEAWTLYNMGSVYDALEQKRKALECYQQALPIFREVGNKQGEAFVLTSIGQIYDSFEERQKTLEYYNQAIQIYRSLDDKSGEASMLGLLGVFFSSISEYRKSSDLFIQALKIYRVIGDKNDESKALAGIGLAYMYLNEYQKSLENYNNALILVHSLGSKEGEATLANSIGLVYSLLGENQKALDSYQKALQIFTAIENKQGVASALFTIGKAYSDFDDNQKALEYYNRALSLFRVIGGKGSEATVLNNIGYSYIALNKHQESLKYFTQALPIFRTIQDRRSEALTYNNLGYIYLLLGENTKTLENLNQALSLSKAIGDKNLEAYALGNFADYWYRQKNPRFAVFYGKQAVNNIQSLRSNIRGLEKETQKTYLKKFEKGYRGLADVLIELGRIAEAEEVLAMLKEEEFFAFLRRDDKVAADLKGKISLSPDEKKAFEDYEKFSDNITRTAQEFGALEKKKNDLPLGASLAVDEQKQYDALKGKYDAAVVVFNKFLNDLKIRFGTNDKRVASLESDTQGILKRLNEPRTVIISTIVGEDRLNLIVTTSDTQRAHTVDIKAADLNVLVAEFRDAVKNPQVDPRPLGKKLYDTLFPAALRKDLDNIKADTIVWSLDGTLRYVPMAALWDGQHYLAERYTNAVLTLASRDKIIASAATDRTKWLALGVGVSKAASVKNADGTTASFDALAAVPQELCSVIADPKKKDFCNAFGKTGVIGGLMLSDDEFTLASFENNLGKVPVVHIASHFSLNAGDESDSYLLLGGGAERRFSLISLKKTRLDKVELLTLSACNTAMTSGANSSGVEIEGFGALAQNQGAKTVLATLWSVADDSTRDLMTEFYRELENNPKIGKAEALRQAQIKLINGKNKPEQITETRRSDVVRFGAGANNFPKFTKDENAPFAHPFYWSPFVLSGNWQ